MPEARVAIRLTIRSCSRIGGYLVFVTQQTTFFERSQEQIAPILAVGGQGRQRRRDTAVVVDDRLAKRFRFAPENVR